MKKAQKDEDEDLIPVNHYGVHTTPEGIVYLHQGRKASNFISMKQPSPYTVRTQRNRDCPHLINPASTTPDRSHWGMFLRLFDDALVQAMLPTPKVRGTPVPFLVDPNNELLLDLVMLSRMGSPIHTAVMPLAKLNKKTLLEELTLTNALPLVLTGAQTSDQDFVDELAQESMTLPRRLVITGHDHLIVRKPLQRITTELWHMDRVELQSMNMEIIGAAILRRHSRGEQINTEFVREKS